MIFLSLKRSRQLTIIGTILFLTGVYALNRHYIRPYIFQHSQNEALRGIMNVFPNFLGVFIFYPVSKYMLGYSLIKSVGYILILTIAVEILQVFDYGTVFDWWDILASAMALLVIFVFEKLRLQATKRKQLTHDCRVRDTRSVNNL